MLFARNTLLVFNTSLIHNRSAAVSHIHSLPWLRCPPSCRRARRDSPGRPWAERAPPASQIAIDHRLHSNRQRTSTERPSKSIDANVDEVSNPSSSATLLACESWLSDLEPLPRRDWISSCRARCATASTRLVPRFHARGCPGDRGRVVPSCLRGCLTGVTTATARTFRPEQ